MHKQSNTIQNGVIEVKNEKRTRSNKDKQKIRQPLIEAYEFQINPIFSAENMTLKPELMIHTKRQSLLKLRRLVMIREKETSRTSKRQKSLALLNAINRQENTVHVPQIFDSYQNSATLNIGP